MTPERPRFLLVERSTNGFHPDVAHVLLRPIGGGGQVDADCPIAERPRVGTVIDTATVGRWAAALTSAVFGVNRCQSVGEKAPKGPHGSSPTPPGVTGVLHRRQFFSEKCQEIGASSGLTSLARGEIAHGGRP